MQVTLTLDSAYQAQINDFVNRYNEKYPENTITPETAVMWFFLDGLDNHKEGCPELYMKTDEVIVTTEKPAMIQLVSDQLSIDPEILK